MVSDDSEAVDPSITCEDCDACCCHLEAMHFNDTGVPEEFVTTGPDGRRAMLRLEDGFCAALDRENMCCSIYERRPWICREFGMGSVECIAVRAEYGEK